MTLQCNHCYSLCTQLWYITNFCLLFRRPQTWMVDLSSLLYEVSKFIIVWSPEMNLDMLKTASLPTVKPQTWTVDLHGLSLTSLLYEVLLMNLDMLKTASLLLHVARHLSPLSLIAILSVLACPLPSCLYIYCVQCVVWSSGSGAYCSPNNNNNNNNKQTKQ